MKTMIKFNDATGKFEGWADGKVVSKSQSKKFVEKRMKLMGFTAPSESVQAAPEVPKVEFGINERFEFIEQFVKMVAMGVSNSLIVAGPGGLGKTHTVTNTLQSMGKKEMGIGDQHGDYIFVKGHSTAKALYRTLFENNGMTIIFDDCDSVFKDPIGANILKAALDSYDKRVISWNAEFSEREDLPNRFEFVGRVIFISNLSAGQMPQAILSRSLKCDVSMTLQEKVERIATVVMSNEFMPQYGKDIKKDVVEFIRQNAEQASDLNIRTATMVAKIRYEMDAVGGDWKRLALYTMVS